jgi:hypothetical protein
MQSSCFLGVKEDNTREDDDGDDDGFIMREDSASSFRSAIILEGRNASVVLTTRTKSVASCEADFMVAVASLDVNKSSGGRIKKVNPGQAQCLLWNETSRMQFVTLYLPSVDYPKK